MRGLHGCKDEDSSYMQDGNNIAKSNGCNDVPKDLIAELNKTKWAFLHTANINFQATI